MSETEPNPITTQPTVTHMTTYGRLKVLGKLELNWRHARSAFINLGGSGDFDHPTFFAAFADSKGYCYSTATQTILIDHGDHIRIERPWTKPSECSWHTVRGHVVDQAERDVFRSYLKEWTTMEERPDRFDSLRCTDLEKLRSAPRFRLPSEGDSELDVAKLSVENLLYLQKRLGCRANQHPDPEPGSCSIL